MGTTKLKLVGRILIFVSCALGIFLANNSAESADFRPPAVPLVTHDPYFSIWAPADRLTGADTVHWTGKPHRLTSLVRIDGKVFRILGASPADVSPLPQTGLEVLPTRTICKFQGEGVRLTLTFTTPVLPDDLDVLSRPATYITWMVQSADGNQHAIQLYFDASAEITVNEPAQAVRWSRLGSIGSSVMSLGSAEQPVLQKKGDDLRIDWGYLLLAARDQLRPRSAMARISKIRAQFCSAGSFVWKDDRDLSRAVKDDAPVLAIAFDLGKVDAHPATRWLAMAYNDELSIRYFGQNLRPYWRKKNAGSGDLVRWALRDFESLTVRCADFDERLMSDLRIAGGEKYARLCALAYRQTYAGNKMVADSNGMPLMFPKENFSNGCIGTVDVLFPQAPFFLVFSPALTKAMLIPILDYAGSSRWPYDYAPHDLGTYPHATGQVYGMEGKDGDRMPVEECGNMLIMLAALEKQESSASFAIKYFSILRMWADYLVQEGLDPQNQLCSADMFGHMPRNANLALKAIIGIGGFGQLCELAGKRDEAEKYGGIARKYAARWQELAKDEGHTRLAYDQPGTWSMKHNLIWEQVLGLNLFPPSVGDAEIAWYLKVQKPFGLPVDNRTDTSLIDWALWSIAPARTDADFQALLDPIYRYANETPSRVPLSDWFVTTDAKQKGFQARPVVGGIFIKMLADAHTWAKWAREGTKVNAAWAPIPID